MLLLQKDYDLLKADDGQHFFSNKVFLIKVHTLLFKTKCYCTLNKLQYNINITFICPRWDGARFHHTTHNGNLKLTNCLFLEFSI